jgi:hypothetical protein
LASIRECVALQEAPIICASIILKRAYHAAEMLLRWMVMPSMLFAQGKYSHVAELWDLS